MFDPDILQRVIELQEKSYMLLKWVNQSLKRSTLDFKYIHAAMSASEAAEEWITRHFDSLPVGAKPKKHEIKEFSQLFSSYLTTSFELSEKPGKRSVSDYGCYCPMCRYLISANHLKTRKITHKARESALELKRIYLESLAEEAELALLPPEIGGLLSDPELSASLSLATYVPRALKGRRSACLHDFQRPFRARRR